MSHCSRYEHTSSQVVDINQLYKWMLYYLQPYFSGKPSPDTPILLERCSIKKDMQGPVVRQGIGICIMQKREIRPQAQVTGGSSSGLVLSKACRDNM